MSYQTFAGQDAEAGTGVSASESTCTAVSGATCHSWSRWWWALNTCAGACWAACCHQADIMITSSSPGDLLIATTVTPFPHTKYF